MDLVVVSAIYNWDYGCLYLWLTALAGIYFVSHRSVYCRFGTWCAELSEGGALDRSGWSKGVMFPGNAFSLTEKVL